MASVEGPFENGDFVTVLDHDGWPLGNGFINISSKLRVRMMTRDTEQMIDDAFLKKRLRDAWEYRKRVIDTGCCRVVFGEADFLPGLTIDKFGDVLVVESLALGMDRHKEKVLELLKDILKEDGIHVRGVYERSDAKERLKEGMERVSGFLGEPFDTNVEIVENGVRFLVDVKNGQKTGYFLDQKLNRLAMQRICRGVDASETGILQAEANARLNGLEDRVKFRTADVFELLPELEAAGEQYDVVILDPPAFTKSRETIKRAVKGYREINLRGMRLVKDGGYLATCSCSHFMDQELFAKTIREAAQGARRRLRQVSFSTQAPDHPILWAAGETYYLKFFIFQVVSEH